MRSVSLFSGCLGLDVGLEAVGIHADVYVENDADCLRLIAARRPDARVIEDVRLIDGTLGDVEALAGGFPCQDLSYAGRGAGLDGDRSALWFEMLRVVEAVRPRLVLVENVPGLLTRGLGVVLHGLARAGYAGRWFTLGAVDVGAPHRRERVFVVARRVESGRGERLAGGHPSGLFAEAGWLPPQETLFDVEPLRRMGKRGRWTLDAVYEDDARQAIDDDSEETLLPTPNAYESTPTADYVEEVREAGVQPDERLYLPGRKWHAQRTLSRIAPVIGDVGGPLLPTPGANDATGAEGETRSARQENGTGGPSLRDLPHLLPTPAARDGKGANPNERDGGPDLPAAVEQLHADAKLLPTPVVTDSFGSRRSTARTDEWGSNAGTTLTDAIWEAQGRETDTTGKLLPTPSVRDHHAQGAGCNAGASQTQLSTVIQKYGLDGIPDEAYTERPAKADQMPLLPTPSAALADGGQKTRGGDRQDELLLGGIAQAASDGQLLPTPRSSPASSYPDAARARAGESLASSIPLLPTPVANPENPGAGGELRAALEHGPECRNGTGVDSLGRPNAGRPSRLLPTPQKSDGDGGRVDRNEETLATGKRPSGTKASVPLATAVDSLLPTPLSEAANRKSRRAMTSSSVGGGNGRRSGGGMSSPPGLEQAAELASGIVPRDLPDADELGPETTRIIESFAAGETSWGVYEPAVRRWEEILGRPAPAPTDEKGRLSPEFVTWMMGLPERWTEVEGVSRTAQLRMLGNAVQKQVATQVGRALLDLDRKLA